MAAKLLSRAMLLIEELRKVDAGMPASYAVALLRVAQEEGLSQSDLMERVGTNKSTIQRIVNWLSEKGEAGAVGHALIETRVADHDARVRTLHLKRSHPDYP